MQPLTAASTACVVSKMDGGVASVGQVSVSATPSTIFTNRTTSSTVTSPSASQSPVQRNGSWTLGGAGVGVGTGSPFTQPRSLQHAHAPLERQLWYTPVPPQSQLH